MNAFLFCSYSGTFQIGHVVANLSVTDSTLRIDFSGRESRILGRPSLKLDKTRITAVSFETSFDRSSLGKRQSRMAFIGGVLGVYRKGEAKIIALGYSGRSYLKISLIHPTIDQIWYFGSDAKALLELLSK